MREKIEIDHENSNDGIQKHSRAGRDDPMGNSRPPDPSDKEVSFSDWLASVVERKRAELRDSRIKDRESPESDSKIDSYRGKRG